MSRPGRFWITLLLPIALFACSSSQAFKEPPAGSFSAGTHQLKIGDAQASVQGASVTKDFFAGSDVQPLLGRFFMDGDFAAPGPSLVVLSNQLWTDRLNSSPTAVGQAIQIDGQASIVVGIAPKGFDSPQGAQFWMTKKL
jgi:hypothetical protein